MNRRGVVKKLYDVRITQCYLIKNIEATNEDEAKQKASEDYSWESCLKDCIMDVEETSDEKTL
tara:strand:+ start:4695 stop:4883 length:189 start_codon:yes stop_codon:yes gene_type:complete